MATGMYCSPTDVATSTGLDADAVREALSGEERHARHAAGLHEATAVVGVSAVDSVDGVTTSDS